MTATKRCVWLAAVVTMLGHVPEAVAQNFHKMPEGGSNLVYLAIAGVSCIGAIVYKFRR